MPPELRSRTHCSDLSTVEPGSTVRLQGWVHRRREMAALTFLVVRDRTGKILWSGDLRMIHSRKVVGLAPFKVSSDNAGAIEVTVAGDPRGTLGTAGEAGSKRFH